METPQAIERMARGSVAKALRYFSDEGIELGYVPRIKYTGTPFSVRPDVLAAVEMDSEFYKEATSLIGPTIMSVAYEKLYGLVLSKEAIEESLRAAKSQFDRQFPTGVLGNDADIFIFSPAVGKFEYFDELMAHEVWHLIEKSRDCVQGTTFIHEGTATYAQNRFAGRPSPWIGAEGNFFEMIYQNVAHVVETAVSSESHPLEAILTPQKRLRIEQDFNRRLKPMMLEKFGEIAVKNHVELLRSSLNYPEYNTFRQDPTQQNLLFALRARGHMKIADEISGQNMTEMLNRYRYVISSENGTQHL